MKDFKKSLSLLLCALIYFTALPASAHLVLLLILYLR